jgi:hypothetical protein
MAAPTFKVKPNNTPTFTLILSKWFEKENVCAAILRSPCPMVQPMRSPRTAIAAHVSNKVVPVSPISFAVLGERELTLFPVGSVVMLMPEADVTVSGPTKTYIDKKTDSGVDLERIFCGFCGSPVYSRTPHTPGKICKSASPPHLSG